ncbi:MAG: isoamylase early set domain-containing protein [Phycisphaerae bacterium]|nr:isoamylase early set domain-containing protein [Phycisphaerae bacterium]
MFTKGRKKGTVRFSIRAIDGVKKASLVGDFNDWRPTAMRKQKDGSFVKVISLPVGAYEYKFIIDGRWLPDTGNNVWAVNPYGTMNSVAEVE